MKNFKLSMTNQILIAVVIGVLAGAILGPVATKVKVVGDIFLRLIQMAVVPLIMGAVIEAVGSLDSKEIGKLGGKIVLWFTIGTIVAAAFGIVAGKILKPGLGVDLSLVASEAIEVGVDQSFSDMLVDFFSPNIIKSMANGNMIQIIVFSIMFGYALSIKSSSEYAIKILDFIKSFNVIILGVVETVMITAPIGIGALLASVIGGTGIKVLLPLLKFLVVFGIASFLYLALVIIFVGAYTKTNPIKLAKKLSKMTLMALTTTSSAITLPTKMEDSETKLGVSKRISRLVNPLGMALNSNGLSMFLALTCLTIAQMYSIDLQLVDIVRIVMLSTLACLGTVVVPGGGIVALTIVIPSIGLPAESIALFAGIDWFSGMFRTMLNVDVDALIAMIIAKDENELDYEIFNNEIN